MVGGAVSRAGRGRGLGREALGMAVDLAILVCPGLVEDAPGGQVREPGPFWLRRRLVKAGAQGGAVLADGRAPGVAFARVFGEAIVREALGVARKPLRLDVRLEPLGSDGGPPLAGMPQGLPDEFALVERLDGSEDGGRVGARASARFAPP